MSHFPNPFNTLSWFDEKHRIRYYSLEAFEKNTSIRIRHLPISIRVILEALLRHCDGKKVTEEEVLRLARWEGKPSSGGDVPFVVSRVILQDFTGVPLLVDLAAMRDAVADQGKEAALIEPLVPVDLVVDHSVQVDRSGTEDAFLFNLRTEFQRNHERYAFLKWGQEAFKTFRVVPPGIGIVHQVNLENIASVVGKTERDGVAFLHPDTLVGTDSHTTMINGLGVVGWGVGGIEAEAAMLGQPVALEMPEVVGVCLTGALRPGVTATDLTLRITELLRKEKVVGKFVEFFGEGAASLSVADRATIANMAPEYGATMGFFPVDGKTLDYLRMTGREESAIHQIKAYLQAQHLFGIPCEGEVVFTRQLRLDLGTVAPSVAGPKRPQDRIDLDEIGATFEALLATEVAKGGYGKGKEAAPRVLVHSDGSFSLAAPHLTGGKGSIENDFSRANWSESEMVQNRPFTQAVVNPGYSEAVPCDIALTHGSVVIAAITSCTNTSNPHVMIAAGLVAKKAVEKGLRVNHMIKTSLAPGSRVVTDYLKKAKLQPYLDQLGFQLVAYGCTTCIGNSGPLDERIEGAVKEYDLVVASVLSGNRNFEARIHGSVKANFLMSPPLVVAFALAGRVNIDFDKEPLGVDSQGKGVFLKEIWPSEAEIHEAVSQSLHPSLFKERYAHILADNSLWKEVPATLGVRYAWDAHSTYIQKPPYFEGFSLSQGALPVLKGMRCLGLFGDSVTTDHISPAGAFKASSPAGKYLLSLGVSEQDFNSYGSRRGNHNVMMRGTFANVRIRNQMLQGKEGGYTKLWPEGEEMPIFEASEAYAKRKVPLILFAGKDYGMGSSRDWAAKGTALLGVRAVVAKSFERIHRSNLVGMGILPLEFPEDKDHFTLKLTGEEVFDVQGMEKALEPRQKMDLLIHRPGGKTEKVVLTLRIDTPMEIEYYKNGGILPYVLRDLLR